MRKPHIPAGMGKDCIAVYGYLHDQKTKLPSFRTTALLIGLKKFAPHSKPIRDKATTNT